MKNLFWITLLVPLVTCAQVSDDFESGSVSNWIFNQPGRWDADNLNPLSGGFSLHHIFDNPEAGADMAGLDISSLRPDLGIVTWQFKIKHGYDPSSSNNWGVYLSSDYEPDFMAPGLKSSGFIIGVNMKGYDDTLRIWKVESGIITVVVATGINWQNDIGISEYAKIVVSRSIDGEWRVSLGIEESSPVQVGEGIDQTWYPNRYFGICYRYSSTRDRLLWFDDLLISGEFVEDLTSPQVISSRFTSLSTISIMFDEIVLSPLLISDNFRIEGLSISPVSVQGTGNQVFLEFDLAFTNKRTYRLIISQLCDERGNCAQDVEVQVSLTYPEWGDIIISEFMADPDPPVHLPNCEYVELYNKTEFDFDLTGMYLEIGTKSLKLPESLLAPFGYIIICDEKYEWPAGSGLDIVQCDGFPVLANSGSLIILTDTSGNTIHGLEYDKKWFNDNLKEEGGWSLEMVDTDYPFQSSENWKFSNSRDGGTPGYTNSVNGFNPDLQFPWLENVYPLDYSTIELIFSEPVDFGLREPDQWNNCKPEIIKTEWTSPLRERYRLSLSKELVAGINYNLTVPVEVVDYNGNSLSRAALHYGLPIAPEWNNLVINEILFDPLPGEGEFIELYNNSNKVFDASELFMVSVNTQTDDTGKPVWLSDEPRCIMPGDFFVITNNKESILDNYTSSDKYYIFDQGTIPTLPDDEGVVLLFTREHDLIDRVMYSDEMHFDLLSGVEGVSLERIDPSSQSESILNWHSASGISGWGTPGLKNSVVIDNSTGGGTIHLSSSKISPDNDGYEDILQITLILPNPGFVIRSIIYSDTGIEVRKLADYTNSGGVDRLFWDGTSASGSLLQSGIYIIFVELTGKKGDKTIYKRVCALVR